MELEKDEFQEQPLDLNKCKNCKRHYRSLMQHLTKKKFPPCYQFYNEQEIKELKKKILQRRKERNQQKKGGTK